MQVKCRQCNLVFERETPHQMICSDACRGARRLVYFRRYNAKHARPLQQRNCEICGDSYQPVKGCQRVCDKECARQKYLKKLELIRKPDGYGKDLCIICGTSFIKRGFTEKTCGDSCSTALSNKRQLEFNKKSFGRKKPNVGEKEKCFLCLASLGFGIRAIIRSIPIPKVTASRLAKAIGLQRKSNRSAALRVHRRKGHAITVKQPELSKEERLLNRRLASCLKETERFIATGLTKAERLAKRAKDRYESDPSYKVYHRCKSMLNKCMRQTRPGMWMTPVFGCDQKELLEHIQKQFQRGMHWNNYGEWEIDHIIPRTSFNFADPEQVLKCNHFSNLRPLWSGDNRSKGNKWGHEERELVRRSARLA
jgi:hypothetical protein